jgi:hypothetical protein
MSGRHKRQGSLSDSSRHGRQDSLSERRGLLPQLKTSGAGGARPPSPNKRLTVTPRDAHLGMHLQVLQPYAASNCSIMPACIDSAAVVVPLNMSCNPTQGITPLLNNPRDNPAGAAASWFVNPFGSDPFPETPPPLAPGLLPEVDIRQFQARAALWHLLYMMTCWDQLCA